MRKDQWAVGVIINGRNLGIWDSLTGGEVDSADTTYRPGAMGDPISLGGQITVGTLTVGRLYDLQRDLPLIHWLISQVGAGTVTISKKALDPDKNVFGKPLTYTGRLKKVTPPEVDSESSDAALITLDITPVGTVT
jgi:hypothetical protein